MGGVAPGEHLAIILKSGRLGREMPSRCPARAGHSFVGGMPLGENVSEADFIGGYLGEAIEVVRARPCRWTCRPRRRIVIEGTFSIEEMKTRGADGRLLRLPRGGRRGGMSPVFRVSAITHRHDPILPVVASGEPIRGKSCLLGRGHQQPGAVGTAQQGLPGDDVFRAVPGRGALRW